MKAEQTTLWFMAVLLPITGDLKWISTCFLVFCCLRHGLFTQSSVISIWTPWTLGLNFSKVHLTFSIKPRKTWIVFHWAYCVKPAKWNFKNVGTVSSDWTLNRFLPQFSEICFCCNACKIGISNLSLLSSWNLLRTLSTPITEAQLPSHISHLKSISVSWETIIPQIWGIVYCPLNEVAVTSADGSTNGGKC